jgi:PAS domain S-box-containing protein
MSIRFSQLLIAVVLALVTFAFFRTMSAYQETVSAADVRMRGGAIVERETRFLGNRIATIEDLAAEMAMDGDGFSPHAFERAARAIMHQDPALRAVDFFNADDVHVAHIDARGPERLGIPRTRKVPGVAREQLEAVELALFDAELSRATSVADIPPKLSAPAGSDAERGRFYCATPVVRRGREIGSIVEYFDARDLIIADVARAASAPFVLSDGRGRPLQGSLSSRMPSGERESQIFAIPFADQVLQLRLVGPQHAAANPWWFVMGFFALVLAIVLPMEVVANINRRVQALNEELETRVAARTKQLEASLEESHRLAFVVESVHEGVMAVGASGFVRYVNAALCKELQCMPHEMLGQKLVEINALGISEQQLADIRAGVSATGFVYREMERRRADGSRYVAGVTFTRHALEGSDALIAVSRDVTERRGLIDQLLETKGRLERETRARADFIATASHELRTPVTTLRTLAALLLQKFGSRDALLPDDQKLLDILDHETQRLANLVDDLLKIAKIDAPEALVAETIDLRSVVEKEVEGLQRFGDVGPHVELHLPEFPVLVRGDEEALRSVVDNLIGNARKFTPPSGRVDVTVEVDVGLARLIVSDTGVGIAKSDLPHIFERFYRAPMTATRAVGAGLGLAIVARLVELMHGTISVASEVGRGTTVITEYPLMTPGVTPEHVLEKT